MTNEERVKVLQLSYRLQVAKDSVDWYIAHYKKLQSIIDSGILTAKEQKQARAQLRAMSHRVNYEEQLLIVHTEAFKQLVATLS